MSRKIILILVVVIIIVLTAVIFTDDTIFLNKKNIVLVGYSKYSQTWIDIKEGAISAGQKEGMNVAAVASDSVHAVADQIQLIEKAVEDRADAIIIMPTDLDELSDVIAKVVHNNIELIIIDNHQTNEEFFVQRIITNTEKLSKDMAVDIAQSSQKDIKIGCIFSYDDNGKSFLIYNEFIKEIKTHENITIVAESISAIDENVASAETSILLGTYDLDYVVCFDETITKGASEYLYKIVEAENQTQVKTKIIGLGSIDECAKFLEDGIIYSLGVQIYYNMGYLSVLNYAQAIQKDTYSAHYIVHKEDLSKEEYQKILFGIG